MRIDDDIHLVASGSAGFDLTDPLDCNAYLVRTGDGWLLFDTGAGRRPESIAAQFAADGIDAARIDRIFLTHAHADHSGGADVMRRLSGARVCASAATARMVSAADEAAMGLTGARTKGTYPADYRYQACPIDDQLADGDTVSAGPAVVECVATPGHSADHFSFRVVLPHRAILVSGDALFAGGRVILQDIPDCSVSDTCESIRRLAAMAFDTLLPGHDCFTLAGARRHADTALAYVERGLCPPSLF